MNKQGTSLTFWDMPTYKTTSGITEIDLPELYSIFRHIKRRPAVGVGLEWPTTRPGEGAERSERFGRGKGYLEAMLFMIGLDYSLIAPNLWKGRVGVPGKTDKEANQIAANLFDHYYSDYADSIRGPRGGIKSGRVDAALIAHWLRVSSVDGIRGVIQQYGADSPQALQLALCGGRRRKKPRIDI